MNTDLKQYEQKFFCDKYNIEDILYLFKNYKIEVCNGIELFKTKDYEGMYISEVKEGVNDKYVYIDFFTFENFVESLNFNNKQDIEQLKYKLKQLKEFVNATYEDIEIDIFEEEEQMNYFEFIYKMISKFLLENFDIVEIDKNRIIEFLDLVLNKLNNNY